MLALDVAPRLAAAILIACIVPTTVVGHAFWQAEGPTRQSQEIHFAKNLGLLGGLLLVLAEKA
jgi:putative oxidoreductase